jgi:5-methylcytosine-specific restriction enzyme A
MPEQDSKCCALCEREVNTVSLHHLVPREEGGRYSQKVPLCQPCHTTLHLTFTNKDLARRYNTIPALLEAEPLQKYLSWIRTKKLEKISNRRSRRKKK